MKLTNQKGETLENPSCKGCMCHDVAIQFGELYKGCCCECGCPKNMEGWNRLRDKQPPVVVGVLGGEVC